VRSIIPVGGGRSPFSFDKWAMKKGIIRKKWVFLWVFGILCAFVYFHYKSEIRALFIASVSNLRMSQKQFWEDGTVTNWDRRVHVYPFTNHVIVGSNTFVCELAAETPALTNWGFVVAATDGTFIWIDRTREATIVLTPEHKYVIPPRFRDF
jgi:hypothetical protein